MTSISELKRLIARASVQRDERLRYLLTELRDGRNPYEDTLPSAPSFFQGHGSRVQWKASVETQLDELRSILIVVQSETTTAPIPELREMASRRVIEIEKQISMLTG